MSSSLSLTSSPGRVPAHHVSRPHWPWSTYTHRSLSSQSSLVGVGGTAPVASSNSSHWESSSGALSNPVVLPAGSHSQMRQHPSLSMSYVTSETTRHWTFTAFEWIVRDVAKLRDFVEGQEGTENLVTGHDDLEILKESPMLGDGKFKLEIARAPPQESQAGLDVNATQPQHLSLYITSLLLDRAHAEYEFSASMMAAIKCLDDRFGERGARSEWVWEFWQNDWTFRQESEVWECPLPRVSTLLENERIRETDSFVICIQIHCPTGPFFPSQPSAYYVPRELLEGLEASLDNPNTGDVQFVCLERWTPQHAQSQPPPNSPSDNATSGSCSSPSSAFSSSQAIVRKRVIYAHSDILTRRSEYFTNMLSSSFSEGTLGPPGGRKAYTIVCEEADFVTIYWLLKWVYANWLLFREQDDPRAAVDSIGAGWSAKSLNSRGNEWDWKTFRKTSASEESNAGTRDDAHSVTSAESLRSKGESTTSSKRNGFQSSATPTSTRTIPSSKPAVPPPKLPLSTTNVQRNLNAITSRRSVASASNSPTSASGMSTSDSGVATGSRTKQPPMPVSVPANSYPSPVQFTLSPHSSRPHNNQSSVKHSPDPHPHPTPPPPSASALSMYQISHRYGMEGLSSLALEHLMSTLTPQSSFSLLLAASAWDTLRGFIEDYVVDNWAEVSVSEEFELCCQEIAAGEWGVQGGTTLTGFDCAVFQTDETTSLTQIPG